MFPATHNFSAEAGRRVHKAIDLTVRSTGAAVNLAGSLFYCDVRTKAGAAVLRLHSDTGGTLIVTAATGRVEIPFTAPAAGDYDWELIQQPASGPPIPWVRGTLNVRTGPTKTPAEDPA